MNTYITFTKKGFFILFSFVVCIGFVFSEISAVCNRDDNARTNAERLSFIGKLGYEVKNQEPMIKTVSIPETFYDVYNNYNALQQAADYDLSLYKGCEVKIYTYLINPPANYAGESVVNLIVYKDRIIGGDVSSTSFDGFMLPLKKQGE